VHISVLPATLGAMGTLSCTGSAGAVDESNENARDFWYGWREGAKPFAVRKCCTNMRVARLTMLKGRNISVMLISLEGFFVGSGLQSESVLSCTTVKR